MDDFMLLSQKNYDNYSREFGQKKVRNIESIILNSKYTAGLIQNSRINRAVPTAKDLGACVLSNFKMSLKGTEAFRFACRLLLDRWNWEVNEELCLASDDELIAIFHEIRNLH